MDRGEVAEFQALTSASLRGRMRIVGFLCRFGAKPATGRGERGVSAAPKGLKIRLSLSRQI